MTYFLVPACLINAENGAHYNRKNRAAVFEMQSDDFIDELIDAIECRYPGAKAEAERIIEERGGIRPFAEFWAKVLADVEAQKSSALS